MSLLAILPYLVGQTEPKILRLVGAQARYIHMSRTSKRLRTILSEYLAHTGKQLSVKKRSFLFCTYQFDAFLSFSFRTYCGSNALCVNQIGWTENNEYYCECITGLFEPWQANTGDTKLKTDGHILLLIRIVKSSIKIRNVEYFTRLCLK